MSKNELSTTNSYTALEGFNLADALSAEMVGMNVTFDRVTIPAAGGTVFEVPGALPGETDTREGFLRRDPVPPSAVHLLPRKVCGRQ